MSRGVSTLEVLIALALVATTLIAVLLLILGTPSVIANARMHHEAAGIASTLLSRELARGPEGFANAASGPDLAGTYETGIAAEALPGGLLKRIRAKVSWKNEYGSERTVSIESVLADYLNAPKGPCRPLLIGNWDEPVSIATGTLMDYEFPLISSLAVTRGEIFVVTAKTAAPSDPALLAFSIADGQGHGLRASFDPYASSTTGYVAVAASEDAIYALTAQASCPMNTPRCAQLDALTLNENVISRIGSYPVPPGKTVTYADGRAYIGLRASAAYPEFIVIDVEDPSNPTLLGNAEVGESVNAIAIGAGRAYVGTANNHAGDKKALMVFDVSGPHEGMAPLASEWQGGAGITQRLALSGGTLYLGRTFLNNSKELYLVDSATPKRIKASMDLDSGIYGLVARSYLLSVLTRDAVEFAQIESMGAPVRTMTAVDLPGDSVGVDLACSGNHLYAASNDSIRGYITAITGS